LKAQNKDFSRQPVLQSLGAVVQADRNDRFSFKGFAKPSNKEKTGLDLS
jgi:hypothetical protein